MQGAFAVYFTFSWGSDKSCEKYQDKGKGKAEEETGNQFEGADLGEPEEKELPVEVSQGRDILPGEADRGKTKKQKKGQGWKQHQAQNKKNHLKD